MLPLHNAAADGVSAELYHEIQHFYARQMQLLDGGLTREWAQTFTEDGVFTANAHPEPARGREVIAASAGGSYEKLVADGETRRHWLGMLTVRPLGEDEVETRCYALVISTLKGEKSGIHCSTVCEDVLVRRDGQWLVKHRAVSRDDLT